MKFNSETASKAGKKSWKKRKKTYANISEYFRALGKKSAKAYRNKHKKKNNKKR